MCSKEQFSSDNSDVTTAMSRPHTRVKLYRSITVYTCLGLKWMNEWIRNKWMNEWINQWMKTRINDKWMNDLMTERMIEKMNEWMNE